MLGGLGLFLAAVVGIALLLVAPQLRSGAPWAQSLWGRWLGLISAVATISVTAVADALGRHHPGAYAGATAVWLGFLAGIEFSRRSRQTSRP